MSLLLPARSPAFRGASALLLTLVLFGLTAAPSHAGQHRIAGSDRIGTSARVAATAFPSGATTAVLARANDYPDALAAAGLAGALSAPVVLTASGGLSPAARQVIADLGISEAVLLGGKGALSSQVAKDLEGMGLSARRVSGTDRYATAAAIARDLVASGGTIGSIGGQRAAFLASGENFPDALAAGAPAYSGRHPLLLARPGSLPDVTVAALDDLGIQRVVILGGTGAVSETVADQLAKRGLQVDRVGGSSRDDTAARLATFAVKSMGFAAENAILVRGDDFPDALSAGPLGGTRGAPILLSRQANAALPSAQWLADNCDRTSQLLVLGGSGVISDKAVSQADKAATDCTTAAPAGATGDFPNADNTGVPAGTSLKSSGSITVTQDGAVIDGRDVGGMISIQADNVTVRRTRIRTNGKPHAISVGTSTSGTVIEDVTIVGTDNNCEIAVAHGHYTLRRADVSGCSDGLRVGSNTTVEDSYVHDLRYYSGAHADAVQSMGGRNIRLVGNTLEGRWRDSTSAIIMGTLKSQLDDVLIQGNRLSGGTFTLYVSQSTSSSPAPKNVRIVDNVWVADSWKYGTHQINGSVDVTWSGNRTTQGKSLP